VPGPRVSFVTPTHGRPHLLPFAYRWLTAMPADDWEWVVLDDSAAPSTFMTLLTDTRVRYLRSRPGSSLGAKRNEAVAASRGRFVVQIDDDDYYAPGHAAPLLEALEGGVGLAKLASWTVYATAPDLVGWVDVAQPTESPWELSGHGVRRVRLRGAAAPTEPGLPEVEVVSPDTGWGFSYAYRREAWLHCPFPDVDWNEDGLFAAAIAARFGLAQVAGSPRRCLHLVHPGSTSASFPCRLLAGRALGHLFPPAVADLVTATGSLPPRPEPTG
jgi:glycosyltransferase involved in cell wall biosynthesis